MAILSSSAMNRARSRGLDLMDINPRPLRNRRRMELNDPALTIRKAWEQVFSELDNSIQILSAPSKKNS